MLKDKLNDGLIEDDDDADGLKVDISDFKREAVERLLLEAIRKQGRKRLPAHQRKAEASKGILGDDDDDEMEAHRESGKLADLHAERGEPAPIPMTDEDMDDDVADSLRDKRTTSSPKADKSSRPRLKNAKYKAKRNPKA